MKNAYPHYPINTANVFATTNQGPWFKGGSWAKEIDTLPIKHRALVIKEILNAISDRRPYTHLRPAQPFEGMGQQQCMAVVAQDSKKSGDMTLCDQPVSHVRYWAEGGHYMGRMGYCAKHVAERHGSDPHRMHALGQSQPIMGPAKAPSPKGR
jgi:hypothetical protein